MEEENSTGGETFSSAKNTADFGIPKFRPDTPTYPSQRGCANLTTAAALMQLQGTGTIAPNATL